MAAATETPVVCPGYSPQEILQEVRNFLHGANYKVQNQRHRESLAQSALVLLRTLPPARQAVLEYLATVFDEAVNSYLLEMDIGHKVTEPSGQTSDNLLHDSCGVLHMFIQTNSAAWAPIISAWSLELLGHISCKYSDRRGVPPTGSLNELLQLWLTCKATKLLIEVATECFAQMVGSAPESCVDTLLEASVKYSPHFDWVVAHIGSSFPRTIITRVLMCGLKDYCHHGNHGDGDMDTKIPKMGSVVGILGHLASKHGHDIRDALMKLFRESIEERGENPRVTTIPFLLQLASMSPLLLHILATDMVKSLSAPVLNRLHVQFQPWIKSYPSEFDSMMSMVVHLVMQSDSGAVKALEFLLFNATVTKDSSPVNQQPPLPEIQKACALIIEQILNETQAVIFRRGRIDSAMEMPFLAALSDHLPHLTQEMLESSGKRSAWLQRLICYIVVYKGEKFGAETLAFILSHAQTAEQLSQMVAIQHKVELGMTGVLGACLQLAMDLLHHHRDTDKLRLLNNIYALSQWEHGTSKTTIRSTFKECLKRHWTSLSELLVHTDTQIAMVTLQLLNNIGIPDNLCSGTILKVCGAVCAMFFRLLKEKDSKALHPMVHACKRCAQFLSHTPYAQSILVRYLMEGTVDQENRYLLGGKINSVQAAASSDTEKLLIHQNQSHGLSLTLLRSHSSVFHAGVIGQGLQQPSNIHPVDQEHATRNIGYLLEMLWICCKDYSAPVETSVDMEDQTHVLKTQGLKVSADMCRMIGNLIVEMTTPDVLYNNRFWPEEESLRMTVESVMYFKEHATRNIGYLLEMLWICCKDYSAPVETSVDMEDQTHVLKTQGLKVSADMCRMIGNLIVEMTTPDVLYNNRFWPEEESLRMTVERDLQVWKMFDENPALWDIMEMLAANTLIMSRSSAVLKSLTATLMHYFESVRETSSSQKQIKCACSLLHCLGKSGLLPAPLGLLSELFPFVTPFEAFLLLLAVWRYMKENPPTEDPGEVARRVCEDRHTDLVVSIAHQHIDSVGHVYARLFKDQRKLNPVIVKQEME